LARAGPPDAQALNAVGLTGVLPEEFTMLKTFLAGSLLMWLGSVTALAADTGASPYAGSEKRESSSSLGGWCFHGLLANSEFHKAHY